MKANTLESNSRKNALLAQNAQSAIVKEVDDFFTYYQAEDHIGNLCDLLEEYFTADDAYSDTGEKVYQTYDCDSVATKVHLTLEMIKFIGKLSTGRNNLPENRINHNQHFQ